MNPRKCAILELPKMTDPRGNLSFVEHGRHSPFEIWRVFYLYDVPSGETHAGHALRRCQQFIVAKSGCFDIVLDFGGQRERFHPNRSGCGAYVPPMIWREIENFSTNSVCLVPASEFHDIQAYVDTHDHFLTAVGKTAP